MDDLRSEFESWVLEWPDITTKYMFGSLAYLVKGRLFAFLDDEYIVITHLSKDTRRILENEYEAFSFESKGKPVGGWMQVSVNDEPELVETMDFVRVSYETALRKSRE